MRTEKPVLSKDSFCDAKPAALDPYGCGTSIDVKRSVVCIGIRRALFSLSVALLLSAPLMAAPGVEDRQERQVTAVSASVQSSDAPITPGLPDEAAMVLAGTALIGAAAAVRRAA